MGKVSCEYVSVPLIQKKREKKHTHTHRERKRRKNGRAVKGTQPQAEN